MKKAIAGKGGAAINDTDSSCNRRVTVGPTGGADGDDGLVDVGGDFKAVFTGETQRSIGEIVEVRTGGGGAVLKIIGVSDKVPFIVLDAGFGKGEGAVESYLAMGVVKLHSEQKKEAIDDNQKGASNNEEGGGDGTAD